MVYSENEKVNLHIDLKNLNLINIWFVPIWNCLFKFTLMDASKNPANKSWKKKKKKKKKSIQKKKNK